MRRKELQTTIYESIEDHFPEDIAELFDDSDLGGVASYYQEVEKDDYGLVDQSIRGIRDNTRDSEWDELVESRQRPAEWLMERVRRWG